MTKVVSLTIRNRAAVLLFVAALLALGAVLFTIGIALLIGLGVAGAVIGAGVSVYRSLRGKRTPVAGREFHAFGGSQSGRLTGLDPALEIDAPRAVSIRPAPARVDDPPNDVKDS